METPTSLNIINIHLMSGSESSSRTNSEKEIAALAQVVRSTASTTDEKTDLGPDFRPGPKDVWCARGPRAYQHEGNERLRELVRSHADAYSQARSKTERSVIVLGIVKTIQRESPKGGFVREENGRWFEVGMSVAREKVGQQ